MIALPSVEPYPMPTAAELPDNAADWSVRPERAVLLVHDMQRYFLRPFVADRPPLPDLMGNIAALRRACRVAGVPVAYTTQPGGMTGRQRGLLADFWGPGMTTDPVDQQVVVGLDPVPGDWVLTKWRYSAFFGTDLLARLHREGRDQLVVCGVYAHIGVLTTAVEAFSNDIEVFVVADAVADFTAREHRMAVRFAAQRCAVVQTTARVLAGLAAGSPPAIRPS